MNFLPPVRRSPLPGRIAAFAVPLLLAFAALPCLAHDFWIQPTAFRLEPGKPAGLYLLVGQHFTGDALPRDPELLRRFVVVGPDGEAPVAGVDGVSPAGLWAPPKEGLYVLGYESGETIAELTAEKMALYVEEEGLEAQLSETAPAKPPIRDAFSRSAKCLILVAGAEGSATKTPSSKTEASKTEASKTEATKTPAYARRLGLPLELVPLADPHALTPDAGLPLELLYQGKPIAGIVVSAIHRDDPLHPIQAATDKAGRVVLPIRRPGAWMIKAVRIERMEGDTARDFRSLWASLTFELPKR